MISSKVSGWPLISRLTPYGRFTVFGRIKKGLGGLYVGCWILGTGKALMEVRAMEAANDTEHECEEDWFGECYTCGRTMLSLETADELASQNA